MVVDGSDDVVGRPFAHVVIIFLNNDLHCNYLMILTMNVPTADAVLDNAIVINIISFSFFSR